MSLVLFWNANPPTDNVTMYTLLRASGLGQPFGSATPIFTGNVLTHADTTAAPSAPYTYFLEATNTLGNSGPEGGVSVTAPGGTIVALEALTAPAIVNVFTPGGAPSAQYANATDATEPATGFVLTSASIGTPVVVFSAGQLVTGLSGLTPGTVYWLDVTDGAITATTPSMAGNIVQQLGISISATTLIFNPQPGTLL